MIENLAKLLENVIKLQDSIVDDAKSANIGAIKCIQAPIKLG